MMLYSGGGGVGVQTAVLSADIQSDAVWCRAEVLRTGSRVPKRLKVLIEPS